LRDPDTLLLDEPTKGIDSSFKLTLAQILKKLTQSGVTVVMVSHDIEFCAKYADHCALFFDGTIVTENTANRFFCGNSFYTTAANRMARHVFPNAVTNEDVIALC
jgi:energy-coupling factor transport system ATP-binding protein